uniref:Phosphatidylinositol-glycan biosynthesis class W protein n=1 Tax=Panagrellus redivivus TaxID=6233 RepID=A0A7E4VJZ4_PANRE
MASNREVEMPRLGDGTDALEITMMGFIGMGSVMMSNFVVELLHKQGLMGEKSVKTRFIAEFFSLMLPCLFMFTIFGDHPFWLLGIMICIGLCILLGTGMFYYHPQTTEDFYNDFRCYLHVITVIAILGVDFPFFHRRFAKTKALGISPMDLGTALHVLCMGYGAGLYYKSFRQYSFKKNGLIFLGLSLLGGIKAGFIHFSGVSYHSEVTEYGVLWNFFISLAILKLITPILFPGVFIVAIGISQFFDLYLDALIVEERNLDIFFDANREGIISLAGYIALLDLGHIFATIYRKLQGQNPTTLKGFLAHLLMYIGIYPFYLLALQIGHEPCRRFANPAYVFICSFFFIGCMTLFAFMNGMSERVPKPASLVVAIGRGSIIVFLTGNLLTGLVNITIDTEKVTDPVISTIIMLVYLFIIAVVGYVLRPAPRATIAKKQD